MTASDNGNGSGNGGPDAPPAETMTVAEAAEALGVSQTRIRQLVNEQKLPATPGEGGRLVLAAQGVHDRVNKGLAQGGSSSTLRKGAVVPPTPAATEARQAADQARALTEAEDAELALRERKKASAAAAREAEASAGRSELELARAQRDLQREAEQERAAKAAALARRDADAREQRERDQRERLERGERVYWEAVDQAAAAARIRVAARFKQHDPDEGFWRVVDAAAAGIPPGTWRNFARLELVRAGEVVETVRAFEPASATVFDVVGTAVVAFYQRKSIALERENRALEQQTLAATALAEGREAAIRDLIRMTG